MFLAQVVQVFKRFLHNFQYSFQSGLNSLSILLLLDGLLFDQWQQLLVLSRLDALYFSLYHLDILQEQLLEA